MKLALPAAAALLAIALALGACGDGDSGTTDTASTPQSAQTTGDGKADGQGKAPSSAGEGSPAGSDEGDGAPVEHDDSGGGSAQFRVKGGDNSVQEFGSEASEAEFDEAAAALHDFLDARVEGDWQAACAHLASDVTASLAQVAGNAERLQGKGCAGILEALSTGVPQSGLKEAAVADVGSLRIEGDRAFVIYRGVEGTVFAIPMTDQDGWKVAALAGTPIS
jgi:hypothetical protein